MAFQRSILLRLVLLPLLLFLPTLAASFVAVPNHATFMTTWTPTTLFYRDLPEGDLPTVQEVATQDFSEQVFYAARIVKELSVKAAEEQAAKRATTRIAVPTNEATSTANPPFFFANSVKPTTGSTTKDDDTDDLTALLQVLLSHPDGMRGFFAAYLTATSDNDKIPTAADWPTTPTILMQVLKGVNLEELTPLLCMNLVVPAATIPWHADDVVLQQNTAKVVQRAQRVMASLKGSINMVRHADAVLAAASGKTVLGADPKLVGFWTAVLDQYQYSTQQRREIERAFLDVLSPPLSSFL